MVSVRRAVVIMFMPSEQEATVAAIRSVLPQLSDSDRLVLLCNGGLGNSLIARLSSHPLVRCYEVERNLGVAGGRNYLFATAEVQSAELLYILDNDLVVPADYLDEMERFLVSRPGVAIAGPIILSFRELQSRQPSLQKFVGSEDPTAPPPVVTNANLLSWAIESRDHAVVEHLGTNRDWRGAYFDDAQRMDGVLTWLSGVKKRRPFRQAYARDPIVVDQVLNGEIDSITVTNIGGGAQLIRRELLNEIGTLCDLFNPYGLEDVDFALRSVHSGYRNEINTRCFLMHGSDGRHVLRTTPAQHRKRLINVSRTSTLLEALWMPDEFPKVAFRRMARNSLIRAIRRVDRTLSLEELYFEMQGVQRALDQLAGGACPLQKFRHFSDRDGIVDGETTVDIVGNDDGVSDERWQSMRKEVCSKIDVIADRYMRDYQSMGGLKGGLQRLLQEREDELRKKEEELLGATRARATLSQLARGGANLASRTPVVGPFVIPSLRWLRRKFAP